MAGSREPVFTNDEKNYMLAEIIKSVSPSPTTMLNLVMQLGAHQPRWDDMPLPPGRSVNACRAAFEDLKRSSGFSPLSQTTAPQTPLSAPIGPLRRPWQLETTTSYPTGPPGRQLAPKPKTEGQGGVVVMPQASATPGAQAKRKRGRPTKAEAQAKAAESSAAAAAGTLRAILDRLLARDDEESRCDPIKMIRTKVAWIWASHNYNDSNHSSSSRNRTLNTRNTRNIINHSRHIRIRTTKARTAESNPTIRQPARPEFDITKTHCLVFNTARDYHQRTFLADILDAVRDLRLGLVTGSRRASHQADERMLRNNTDLGSEHDQRAGPKGLQGSHSAP
ncbi:hypothetical protein Q7P35_001528 [Cladosporium inversicolor]